MIQEVKKTLEDELKECTEAVGKVWFEMGRAFYEKEIAEKRLGELSTKAHNLNQAALKLNDRLLKEKAADKAMEVKLAPAPTELTQ